MIAIFCAVAMTLGIDPLQPPTPPAAVPSVAPRVELGAISLKIPLTWQRRMRSGTHRFDAPKGNAYFVVDTGEVKTNGMEPSVCLGKITEALAQAPARRGRHKNIPL